MVRLGLISDPHYGFNDKTHEIWMMFLKECSEKRVDGWILAGDIGMRSLDGLRRALKLFRSYIPRPIPVGLVWGNHDFYDYESKTLLETAKAHATMLSETSIQHLSTPLIIDDVIIAGFDGWYEPAYTAEKGKHIQDFTNDHEWMPKLIEGVPMHQYMRERAWKDMNKFLEIDTSSYRKVVAVTHFPMFTENNNYKAMCANFHWLQPILDKSDVLCVGHFPPSPSESDGMREFNTKYRISI